MEGAAILIMLGFLALVCLLIVVALVTVTAIAITGALAKRRRSNSEAAPAGESQPSS